MQVDESFSDDPRQVANLDDFRQRLRTADFSADSTLVGHFNSGGGTGDQQYAGSESCARCHEHDSTHWRTTKHAAAWDSLQPKQSFADPFCQQCHTTGYGQPGGFQTIAKSLSRTNVGCESCHGPSSQHVAEPLKRTPFQSRDQCVVCHDRENSPNFRYDEYWSKIVHGEKLNRSEASGDNAGTGS